MTGYTKLFGSILASTIWQESKETKLVWITMLAASNKNGEIEASIPGLAHIACLTVQETKEALEVLMSPDPYSRTPDHEGRRIVEIPGGWRLLNHGKYREKMSEHERREYNRIKQEEHRKRIKASMTVNDSKLQSALSAHTDTDSDSKAVSHPKPELETQRKPSGESEIDFQKAGLIQSIVAAYPVNGNAIEAQRSLAAINPTSDQLREIKAKVETFAAKFAKLPMAERRYCPAKHTFFEGRRWDDNPNATPWTAGETAVRKFSKS